MNQNDFNKLITPFSFNEEILKTYEPLLNTRFKTFDAEGRLLNHFVSYLELLKGYCTPHFCATSNPYGSQTKYYYSSFLPVDKHGNPRMMEIDHLETLGFERQGYIR